MTTTHMLGRMEKGATVFNVFETVRENINAGNAVNLILGDSRVVLSEMAENSVDSIVCDPPYMLGFMGKAFDHPENNIASDPHFWREALRVAKPGAHLLAFGGTRTFHRLACAIEDAGWELRDTVMWVYGSGFPKSADVSKHIDKQAGAEREVVGKRTDGRYAYLGCDITGGRTVGGEAGVKEIGIITAPATSAAAQWQGWGTALKPAWEPIIMARKPLERGLTVAANVLKWGTGALNVDGCRVGTEETVTRRNGDSGGNGAYGRDERIFERINPPGRWPANLIHDGSDEVLAGFPVTTSGKPTNGKAPTTGDVFGKYAQRSLQGGGDTGVAARFFYCAKASKRDRDEGCEGLEERKVSTMSEYVHPSEGRIADKNGGPKRNFHPTVKPTALMRYLVRLVTLPGGLILDPFMGSGSTGKAALIEGFRFVGIEQDAEYIEIAKRRIAYVERQRLHNVGPLPAWVGDVWE